MIKMIEDLEKEVEKNEAKFTRLEERPLVIDFLEQYVECSLEWKRLCDRVEELTSQAERMTQILSGMPSGGSHERGKPIWDELIEARIKCVWAIKACLKAEQDIWRFLRYIPITKYRLVLQCRYLAGMSWSETAERMGYEERHTKRVGKEAIAYAARRFDRSPIGKEYQDELLDRKYGGKRNGNHN